MMRLQHIFGLVLIAIINLSFVDAIVDTTTPESLQEDAKLLMVNKKYQLANQKLQEAQSLLAQNDNWQAHAEISIDIAMNYYRIAKDSLAIATMQTSIDKAIEKLPKDDPLIGLLYHKFGVIYYFLKDYDKASSKYKEAIRIREKMKVSPNPDLAGSYYNLGLNHSYKGEYETAITNLKKSIKIRKLQKDTATLAQCYKVLGENYGLVGDYQEAIAYMENSLELYRNFYGEIHLQVGLVYYEMGKLYSWIDLPNKAIAVLQNALNIYVKLNYEKRQANTLYYLNKIYRQLNQFDQALAASKQALAIHQKNYGEESIYVAKGFNNIGLVYKAEQKYDLAIQNLQHSLSIRKKIYKYQKHPDIAISYDNIGNVLHEEHAYPLAIKNYQLALSQLLPSFNDTLTYTNPDFKTMVICKEKLSLLTVLMDKAIALKALYQSEKEIKHLELALESFELCSQLLELMRKEYENDGSKLFWSGKIKPFFEQAIETALLLYELTEKEAFKELAFRYAEKSKASLLVENRKEIAAQGFANIPKSILGKERKIKTKIVQLQDKIYQVQASEKGEANALKDSLLSLNNSYNEFVDQLEKDYPKYHRFKYTNERITLKSVQEDILEKSTCLIEFFFGAKQIYVFAISQEQTQVKTVELTTDLLDAIKTLKLTLSDESLINKDLAKNYLEFSQAANHIYTSLFQEIESLIQDKQKLIIIPDGLLAHIPFECLLYEKANAEKTDFLALAYLIKKHEISYAYSSILLKQNELLAKSLANNNRLITFAPDYSNSEELLPLIGAQEETKRIISFYPKYQIFEKENATKENFKKHVGAFAIVHLALHANVDAKNSERSCLYFSSANDKLKDNVLYNYELYALDLKAKLVVLSACETGTGQSLKGEGVMSLARGFMNAGTAAVVMSLWSTNDKSSQQLMVDFHRQLSSDQAVSTALHLAKLDYLQNPVDPIGHPYYWAGFISTGSTSKLLQTNASKFNIKGIAVVLLLAFGMLLYFNKSFS